MTNTALKLENNNMMVIDFPEKGLTNKQIDNRIRKLQEAEKEKKRIEKEINALKEEIKNAMHGAETIETGNYIIRNTVTITKRLDTKAIKTEMPEIYNQFTRESISTRFSYKEA